ncbi:hypothetical protein BWI17_21605 [Betaproteobacteria bacterium GR16-43]|nr:hypothetical protein BWI17_21605 [Betaproteobacteria bacterium GR16-43]
MPILLAPGIELMRRVTNKVKMPLVTFVFLAPTALLYAETRAHASTSTLTIVFLLAATGVYLMVSWFFQSRDGFDSLARIINRVADGDLSASSRHEVGGHFKGIMAALAHVNSSLGGIVANVRASAGKVARSAHEIATSSGDLATRTENQATTLEQTAAGMEELSQTVIQNAKTCETASALAREAEAVAKQGAQAVHGVVHGMGVIDQSSRRIADITGVIDGIAFQTNILALNAAVEAARAGEQGRGFAVVATEVRALAQRSAAAAKEIKALIEQSVGEIRDGSVKAERAGKVIDEIVSSVQEVSQLIGQVAASSSEQSAGVAEINRALTQLEGATQMNSSLVHESAANSLSLQEQAEALNHLVARFKTADEVLPRRRV